MIGGTNLTLLNRALRADGRILKPAFAAHRIDRFYVNESKLELGSIENSCAGDELWSAPTLPARANSSARHDRRANSMARLFASLPNDSISEGVWWYSILSWDMSDSNCSVSAAELSPPAVSGRNYVVSKFGTRCKDGAPARSCVEELGDRKPPLLAATETSGTGLATDIMVHHVAPVLSRGWVVLGEQNKYVAVSPQRFMAAHTSKSAEATDFGASDALLEDELLSDDNAHLTFYVLGDPGERVDIAVIAPKGNAGSWATKAYDIAIDYDVSVLSGTVVVVKVVVGPSGRSQVGCTTLDSPQCQVV